MTRAYGWAAAIALVEIAAITFTYLLMHGRAI